MECELSGSYNTGLFSVVDSLSKFSFNLGLSALFLRFLFKKSTVFLFEESEFDFSYYNSKSSLR